MHVACLLEGMLLLARVYRVQGQLAESHAVLRRLREKLVIRGCVELLPLVLSFEMFVTFLDSPGAAIGELLTNRSESTLDVTPHLLHHPLTATVLLDSEAGPQQAEHALSLAREFAERATAIHFTCWLPEIFALQAIALSALERDSEAVAMMRTALAHGVAKYLTRTLLDLGPRSQILYRSLADDPEVGDMARSLIKWVELAPPAAAPVETVLPHPAPMPGARQTNLLSLLTDRELEVLELLERRLSYKEIGGTLHISPLTVKRHAGNIYDKLGVNCRREAVGTAHDLGWKSVHRSM
jgi:LuxR family maltose regulon positive regulatory protein